MSEKMKEKISKISNKEIPTNQGSNKVMKKGEIVMMKLD